MYYRPGDKLRKFKENSKLGLNEGWRKPDETPDEV